MTIRARAEWCRLYIPAMASFNHPSASVYFDAVCRVCTREIEMSRRAGRGIAVGGGCATVRPPCQVEHGVAGACASQRVTR